MICISQQDEEEKGKQIPFMNVIYRGTSTVLVWLGNYPEQPACFAVIKAYPRCIGKGRGPDSRERRQEHSEVLASLVSLLRCWIVQEAVLNPDVLLCRCDEQLSWVQLANCLEMISDPLTDMKLLHTALAMTNLWKRWVLNSGVARDNNGIFDPLEAFEHL